MEWFNYYGLAIMAIIMIPNIVYAVKHRGGESAYQNRFVEALEQIGRYACFALMIINIPYACFGFWFPNALIVYLSVNGALCAAYLVFWAVCGGKRGMLRALSLSVLPTAVFLVSGVLLAYLPLVLFACLFGACHIFISCKSAERK